MDLAPLAFHVVQKPLVCLLACLPACLPTLPTYPHCMAWLDNGEHQDAQMDCHKEGFVSLSPPLLRRLRGASAVSVSVSVSFQHRLVALLHYSTAVSLIVALVLAAVQLIGVRCVALRCFGLAQV
ncbi:hypothetical protein BKA65DRAFT_497594, partial [Rhexocercosporidium sp. MPI-PUGE-AT-0058]